MAKISLLVNLPLSELSTTPFFVMPPGLLSIAAYLKEKDEAVDFIDLNVVKRNVSGGDVLLALEEKLRESKPMLVGVSVMVAGQFKLAHEVCKKVKQVLPGAITVAGGAHVSQFPNEILKNCPSIDFVVMGEGERQAYACVQFAKTGKNPHEWPAGIAFRDKLSAVVFPLTSFSVDVDTLPWPAYDLVRFDDYRHDTRTWHNPFQVDLSLRVPIITSRGCPNLCNFCSVAKCMGLKYRAMNSQNVADMLQMLYDSHGARYFAIFDANFAQDTHRVINLCDEIVKRGMKITLDLPTGLPINATAPALIDALAGAGLIRTCISVETGDEFIRNNVMLKQVDHDEIYKVVAAIRRHPQIFLMTDYVMGMPEETVESLETSCKLITDLDTDDITLSIATPYPGTALFEQCQKDGLFLPDVNSGDLYQADWYCHSNVNKFVIKPYKLDLDILYTYRDRILALRKVKIASYEKRMETLFAGIKHKER